VDVATGEMVMPAVDVSLPGELPLLLARTHLSTYRRGLFFGPSWASTLEIAFNRMPGWDGQAAYNRTHLPAASLGGSNNMPENFVTAHRYANHPVVYPYESQAARAAARTGRCCTTARTAA
jgi:hypothetical protein